MQITEHEGLFSQGIYMLCSI